MKLSREEVLHLAELCRLRLSEAEIKKFQAQLSDILEYVDILNEVDTANVEPTAQVTGLVNVSEKDEVRSCENPEALLACSPLPIKQNQIKVRSVF